MKNMISILFVIFTMVSCNDDNPVNNSNLTTNKVVETAKFSSEIKKNYNV